MRIVVDRGLCEGNGVCVAQAPEVFLLGDDDQVKIHDERPAAALLAKVERAIKRCPRQALSLRDD